MIRDIYEKVQKLSDDEKWIFFLFKIGNRIRYMFLQFLFSLDSAVGIHIKIKLLPFSVKN